jgi:hypothetical protein
MAIYNITVNKNADFTRSFQVKIDGVPVDINGYQFAATLKENIHETAGVDFTTVIASAVDGLFNISLTDETTASMKSGTWVYDLVMTDTAGFKTRLLEGQAFVKGGVTA